MFYNGMGSIVEPFKFTNEERTRISACFGGDRCFITKKSKQAQSFIDKLEIKIEFWLSLQDEPTINNSDLQVRLYKIAKQCEQLIKSVSEVDKKMSGGVCEALKWHYRKNGHPVSIDDTEIAINSLMEITKRMGDEISGVRSHSKQREKLLARLMVDSYLLVFNAWPGTAEECNFIKVVQVVESVLEINIGADVIKASIKQISDTAKPPCFYI